MTPLPIPINAGEIYVHWRIDGGGIGVTAFTDETGKPYIGLYPLNWNGDACGPPVYLQRMRFMADIVVGFMSHMPVVVFIDAEIDGWGLRVRLEQPRYIAAGEYPRHISARWGESPPRHRLLLNPANSNGPYPFYFKEEIT